MGNRYYAVFELLYGTALLTAVGTTPDILMKLRLNDSSSFTVAFSYPEVWITMIRALLLTALAMLPTVVRLPKRLARRHIINYVYLAPWILMCCFKFLVNVIRFVLATRHVAQFKDSTSMIMALAIYCIIFGMAIEMMLHWTAIADLTQAGFLLQIRRR